jgi:pyruvate/2-oxoglutarate dehydrogenase complex dihydrolipoamide acyltransferase (E2) component
VIRAVALALQRHPIFNASYDPDAGEIIHHDYLGIAVGVHTERGLIAPVLRDADRMTIPAIADELARLAEKARTVSFEVNDTRGGTFTISNAGAMGGSRYSTPIINHPQAAVLAVGRSRWQPWVVEGTVVGRLILPLSVSFDHRIIDGAHAIAFMREIVTLLQKPAGLMLE